MWNGDVSRASRYFDSAHALPQETTTGKTLVDRFGTAFPAEILAFSAGAPVDVPEVAGGAAPGGAPDALPTVTVPTLFVTHGAEWSGTAWESKTPRGIYVGLTAVFDVAFVIPSDARAHRFKLALTRPVPIQLLH